MNEVAETLAFARNFRARYSRMLIVLNMPIYSAFSNDCRIVAAENGNRRVTVMRDDPMNTERYLIDLDDLELRA